MPMLQGSAGSPQGRALTLAMKRALRRLHDGGIPRKVVWGDPAVSVSEGQYSKWLDDGHSYLPDALQVVAIVNLTGDLGLLAALAAHCGEGFDLAASAPEGPIEGRDGLRLLSATESADARVHQAMAQDLADDGQIDPEEARKELPAARERARQAKDLVLRLERVALGAEPLPLRRAE